MIAVYIPCADEDEAEKIARALVDEKLVACANIWPVKSFYQWRGELTKDTECVLFAKTTQENYAKIKEKVRGLHSYDLPAIVKLPIETNKDYEKWLRNEVQ